MQGAAARSARSALTSAALTPLSRPPGGRDRRPFARVHLLLPHCIMVLSLTVPPKGSPRCPLAFFTNTDSSSEYELGASFIPTFVFDTEVRRGKRLFACTEQSLPIGRVLRRTGRDQQPRRGAEKGTGAH